MNKRLTTDMADANGLKRPIRPTGFFNIKKMAVDFCSAQYIMDKSGSLRSLSYTHLDIESENSANLMIISPHLRRSNQTGNKIV